MSSIFQYPNKPIYDGATPQDFAKSVADVPFMGIYTAETTQRYVPSTRYITWDGRVYKYAKAKDTVGAYKGNSFAGNIEDDGIAYATLATSQVAGDTQISIASQTFAKDELAGGYAGIYGSSGDYNQFRGIVGNNLASAATVTLDLEAPLDTAVTAASTAVEVAPNPYLYISGTLYAYCSIAGVAAKRATVGQFFWLQTWGPCHLTPGATISKAAYMRQLIFQHDGGSVNVHNAALATTVSSQHAGFILDSQEAQTADCIPFVMLQISI